MDNFKTRIKKLSKEKSKIILANDYNESHEKLVKTTVYNIKKLNKYICGIKINYHLLLPLGIESLNSINDLAHKFNLQTIADIKLNDIFDTNKVVIKILFDSGFDAIIVNPVMGSDNIRKIINIAHKNNSGIISICHLSSFESNVLYNSKIILEKKTVDLYKFFLELSIKNKADGIIIGATFPEIIKQCKLIIKNKLDVYSPGIGIQGGSIHDAIPSGSDFLIVGRMITRSKDPVTTIKNIRLQIEKSGSL